VGDVDCADGLDRLAQSHVVCQDAVQMVLSEPVEPVDSRALVRSKLESGLAQSKLCMLGEGERVVRLESRQLLEELLIFLREDASTTDLVDELL
jgi:hypothetical protein